MKTQEFISLLEKHPKTPLFFEYAPGQYVRSDYHITEVKNVDFDTVDCGGQANKWSETHVQLWENEALEPDHQVDSSKALKIFEVVDKVRPTYQDSTIKFEYGNRSFTTAILPIGEIELDAKKIVVKLGVDQTACKAKDRAQTAEEKAQACCGPVPSKKSIVLTGQDQNECTPGSGCC
ncbi:DUF6428 family protein [Echinicola rosea]|uniref:Uncharacterized protein n=1 Tax=Echinicola rosea TaxID=1807691 RepID=A0ABQ1V3N4_9BACT|nr:DUF6428 family protein [Echinicola rosea]GGF36922.1 hypothetical protein GCM10011339_26780 [Echinicola rosea]